MKINKLYILLANTLPLIFVIPYIFPSTPPTSGMEEYGYVMGIYIFFIFLIVHGIFLVTSYILVFGGKGSFLSIKKKIGLFIYFILLISPFYFLGIFLLFLPGQLGILLNILKTPALDQELRAIKS